VRALLPRGDEARESCQQCDKQRRCGCNLPRSGRVSNVSCKQKLVALDLLETLSVRGGFEVLGVAKNLVQHVWGQIGESHPGLAIRMQDRGRLQSGQIAGTGESARRPHVSEGGAESKNIVESRIRVSVLSRQADGATRLGGLKVECDVG
jgi:hypothetical protein